MAQKERKMGEEDDSGASMKGGKTSELVISREFDVPVSEVWQAWTNPDQVKEWWGPKQFSTPVSEIDFREGGSYLLCMQSPQGQKFCSTGKYEKIIPEKKIVSTDSFSDEKGKIVPATHYGMSSDFPRVMNLELDFEAEGNKTRLTIHHDGIPKGKDRSDAEQGWNESLDKLAQTLSKQKNKM